MTDLIFSHDPSALPSGSPTSLSVLMYGRRPPCPDTASIGGPVIDAVRRLGKAAHPRAFDFLTISMAVTAADTFVDREASQDGWCRDFRLELPLADPRPWRPVIPELEAALRFLSGDQWSIRLTAGGPVPPQPQVRGQLTNLSGHDCASLFSGGLDSAIGVLDLIADGKRPVLISHAYRGDARRQQGIRALLPVALAQFAANANPVSALLEPGPVDVELRKNYIEPKKRKNDVQMRTRSFNFLAYGAVVAATMADQDTAPDHVDLCVPENGLIALNAPLTPRRIGSLSTRTTHPHFLAMMRDILSRVGIPVNLVADPYDTMTKGQMMVGCRDQATLGKVAAMTVSCGKWKRTGLQCGRCVPCIIRRAAFHSYGPTTDTTDYAPAGQHLPSVLSVEEKRGDLVAMIIAADQLQGRKIGRWIAQSGPLPADKARRDQLEAVAQKGMEEVREYLRYLGLVS